MSKTSQRQLSIYSLGYDDARKGLLPRYKLNTWSRKYYAGRRKYFYERERQRKGLIQKIADAFH